MPRGKSQRTLDLIDAAREVLEEIQPASVRAVCYRLFTMDVIESMVPNCTKRVSAALVYAREHEIVPWEWIVDETREAEYGGGWENPGAFVEAAKRSYRRNRWATQPQRVEVWSEKGTVRGTLAPVLQEYGVTFRVMHGYASATAVHQAAEESAGDRRPWRVLYVGDWDPSGLHMSEVDLPARLDEYGARILLTRVALSADDIADPALPSFDADTKRTDTRWRWFTSRYGDRCWELDALSPVVLRERVEAHILALIEPEAWNRAGLGEAAEQKALGTVLGRWQRSISGQVTK